MVVISDMQNQHAFPADGSIHIGKHITTGEQVYLNLFDPQGKPTSNANMVILGRAGSGKAYHQKSLHSKETEQGVHSCVIDHTNELEEVVRQLGGTEI